jgi:hypothetical protein
MIELAVRRSQWPQHSYFSSGRNRVHFQHSSAGLIFAWPYIVLGDEFAFTTEHDIDSAFQEDIDAAQERVSCVAAGRGVLSH